MLAMRTMVEEPVMHVQAVSVLTCHRKVRLAQVGFHRLHPGAVLVVVRDHLADLLLVEGTLQVLFVRLQHLQCVELLI